MAPNRARNLERSRCLAMAAALALVTCLVLAGAAEAGTGRLLSNWMSHAPAIDGATSQFDWAGAQMSAVGSGLTVLVGNDARTLYIGVFDGFNSAVGPGDFVALFFDDEGGTAPVRDDGAWGNPGCQAMPNAGEGELVFAADGSVTYMEVVAPSESGVSEMKGAVATYESLGEEGQLAATIGNATVLVVTPPTLRLQRGEAVTLRLRPDHIHLFDASTQAAL